MTEKSVSWSGTHPLERLYRDVLAHAERAEAEADALRAQLESAITVSINGALHRVLPAPVGYAGTDETVWLVEHGKMHVQPFALWPNAPDDAGQG